MPTLSTPELAKLSQILARALSVGGINQLGRESVTRPSAPRTRPGPVDLGRGDDEADVAERLREVPELFAGTRVDLLGQEAEIVRVAVSQPCQAAVAAPPGV